MATLKTTCVSPIFLKDRGHYVRCGKCTGCRIVHSFKWSQRLADEIQFSKFNKENSFFVTLTYNNMNLPLCLSVCKRHLQLFFKRLRKNYPKETKNLKYFASAEYGGKFGRPHYHLILIGLPFSVIEKDSYYVKKVKNGFNFECKLWDKGICNIQSVCDQNIRYTTNYVLKKRGKDVEVYKEKGLQLPFTLVSKGIGKDYAFSISNKIEKDETYFVKEGLNKKPICRYYRLKNELDSVDFVKTTDDVMASRFAHLLEFGKKTPSQLKEIEYLETVLKAKGERLSIIEKLQEPKI